MENTQPHFDEQLTQMLNILGEQKDFMERLAYVCSIIYNFNPSPSTTLTSAAPEEPSAMSRLQAIEEVMRYHEYNLRQCVEHLESVFGGVNCQAGPAI